MKAKAGSGSELRAEMQVFGWVAVPLAGLLGTPGLDAIVTCELEATKSTLASVLSRQHLLPSGMRHTGQGTLGPKLGKLTCRLTIVCDNQEMSSSSVDKSNGIDRCTPSHWTSVTAGEVKRSHSGSGTAHSPAIATAPQSLLLLPTHISSYHRTSPAHVFADATVNSTVAVVAVAAPASSHRIGIRDPESTSSSTESERVRDKDRGREREGMREMDKYDRERQHADNDTLHAAMNYVPSEAQTHNRHSGLHQNQNQHQHQHQHQHEYNSQLAHNLPSTGTKVHDRILFDKKGSDGRSGGGENAETRNGVTEERQQQGERGSGRDRRGDKEQEVAKEQDNGEKEGRSIMGVSCKSLFGLDVGALQPPHPHPLEVTQGQVVVCRVIVAYKKSRR